MPGSPQAGAPERSVRTACDDAANVRPAAAAAPGRGVGTAAATRAHARRAAPGGTPVRRRGTGAGATGPPRLTWIKAGAARGA